MQYLFYTLYLVFFCWLLTKIKFIRTCGIAPRTILFLFLARVIVGLIYDYINLHYYSISDTVLFQKYGLEEYQLMLHHPKEYILNIFQNSYSKQYAGFFDTSDSYWNDLRSTLIYKLLSVFNLFSLGNFYINSLFFNFLVFFGSIFFYRTFIKIYPTHKILIIIGLFLLPSFLYFTSGFHRDGLIFLILSIITYYYYLLLKTKEQIFKWITITVIFLIALLLLRNFVFITIIPAMIAWTIAERKPKRAFRIFTICYAIFITTFFALRYISPKLNFPAFVSARQIAFIKIAKDAGSAIYINPLFPGVRSFVNNVPQALNHALMRPYLTEEYTLFSIPISAEIFIYELIFIFFLFFRRRHPHVNPFIYFCIYFSFSMFLVIGYTIPIIGAIVRYRSIYLPLLMVPLLCNIDWLRVKNIFTKKTETN